MAIIGVGNRVTDFENVSVGVTNVTTAGTFDSNYVPGSMGFSTGAFIQKNFTAAAGVVTWFRFTHYRSSTSGSGSGTSDALSIWDASGNLILSVNKTSTTSNSHLYTLYGATNATSASVSMPSATASVVTIQIDNTGAGTVATIYSGTGGTVFATLTVADRETRTNPTQFRITPSSFVYSGSAFMFISEVIVADSSLIGRRLIQMNPNTVGDASDMAGTIAELNDTDALTGLTSDTAGQRHSWNNAAYAGPAGTLDAVIVSTVGHRASGAPSKLAPYLRLASTNYDGADVTIGASTLNAQVWALNPNTGLAWASGDLASMQTGIKSAA